VEYTLFLRMCRAAGAAAARRRRTDESRQKFVARRDNKARTKAAVESSANQSPDGEDEASDVRNAARLQQEDIKTTIAIVHNTNETLKEADTGAPSRLVKDLFLEPSGALHDGAFCESFRQSLSLFIYFPLAIAEFESMKLDSTDPESAEFLGCCQQRWLHRLAVQARKTRDHVYFQTTIIAFIVVAGILVGLQTYDLEPRFGSAFLSALAIVDQFVLAVFAIEVIIKVVAQGRHPSRFVYDTSNGNLQSWNVFDFIVVRVCIAVHSMKVASPSPSLAACCMPSAAA
jgi:hypothetical protein